MPSSDSLSLDQFPLKRLTLDSTLKEFDCGREDINGFFHEDSINYLRQLLGVTYVFENGHKTVAFFTVSNDKIINRDSRKRIIARKLVKLIPNNKRRQTYPAVKVGRLGVHNDYKRVGIGSQILNFIKHYFTDKNKTGCRFITVDAYNDESTLPFYLKNGFTFLTDEDKSDETRLMWFDLLTFHR